MKQRYFYSAVATFLGKATGKVAGIRNPAPEAGYDFKYILRGTKKNLILVNEFVAMSPDLSSKKGVERSIR